MQQYEQLRDRGLWAWLRRQERPPAEESLRPGPQKTPDELVRVLGQMMQAQARAMSHM